MKILLQNRNTKHYVNQAGGWTRQPGAAHVFTTGFDAIMFCLHHQIRDMQIVCAFEDLKRNFTISVTDSRQSL